MAPQTITLGMMLVVTGGRNPITAAAQELSVFLAGPYHDQAKGWAAAAEYERRSLLRGDVLWTCLAPIDCAWLLDIPMFAVPYGTSDRWIIKPAAVFIGTSPRYKRHSSWMWLLAVPWASRWCEQQPYRLAMLAKRDEQHARTTVHVYAPSEGELVADYWQSLRVRAWSYRIINPDRPDLPATMRTNPSAFFMN